MFWGEKIVKKTVFIKNAAVLTASSLILRFAGIVFKVWMAGAVGSEGVGLYQVIFSVYALAAAFSACGICTAVTRLVSEELVSGSKNGIKKTMRGAFILSMAIAFVSFAVLWFGAGVFAQRILRDSRAVLSIKALSLSLFSLGISSNIRGYFIARRKTAPFSAVTVAEQAVRIGVAVLLVNKFKGLGLSYLCAALFIGDTAAELVCSSAMILLYRIDINKLKLKTIKENRGYKRKIFHIAFPITAGRYLNSLLRTAENIMMPKALSYVSGNSLSLFGMIKGMALPVLFFPGILLNSLSTLLIPEISEASVLGKKSMLKSGVERIIILTSLMGFIFSAVFMTGGKVIGELIYKSEDVGILLVMLSPIVPLMYLDIMCDGILKGLDQQAFTFRTSILDSLLRLVLIYFIVPKYGLNGFIAIMYISNALTCILNISRLIKVTDAKIDYFKNLITPLFTAFAAAVFSNLVLKSTCNFGNSVYIILLCVFSLILYALGLLLFGCTSISEFKRLISS